MNGEELIRSIMKVQTDLFWFGGIGTYVKSPTESHLNVGDQANDAVRIDSNELRAKVVGEGANLGLTQLARIDFSRLGGKLNTDAIDNSAGVNMSDYEVNVKILLKRMMQDNNINTQEERNELLRAATDEVAELVLLNNRGQHRLISMDAIRSETQFKVHCDLVRSFVASGHLDAQSERIPGQSQLEIMEEKGEQMPRPVLAVLQAYVKMEVYKELLESLPWHESYFDELYARYFPNTMLDKFRDHIDTHQLRKEIITTIVTNELVNQAGMTFMFRMKRQTGKSYAEIASIYILFSTALKGDYSRNTIWDAQADNEESKYQAIIAFEQILQRLVLSLLSRISEIPEFSIIKQLESVMEQLKAMYSKKTKLLQNESKKWKSLGFENEIADMIALNTMLWSAPEVLYLHDHENLSVEIAAHLAQKVDTQFGFSWLIDRVATIKATNDWELSQQDILSRELHLLKNNTMILLLRNADTTALGEIDTREDIVALVPENKRFDVDNYFATLDKLQEVTTLNVTMLTVCVHHLSVVCS
jgi:glutamate dehydrogenase